MWSVILLVTQVSHLLLIHVAFSHPVVPNLEEKISLTGGHCKLQVPNCQKLAQLSSISPFLAAAAKK